MTFTITLKIKFRYEIKIPRDSIETGRELSNGSWTGAMGMIARKERNFEKFKHHMMLSYLNQLRTPTNELFKIILKIILWKNPKNTPNVF